MLTNIVFHFSPKIKVLTKKPPKKKKEKGKKGQKALGKNHKLVEIYGNFHKNKCILLKIQILLE